MKNIVFDSWSIIAWLQGESPGEKVRNLVNWVNGERNSEDKIRSLIGQSTIVEMRLLVNIVNLGEVFYILGRRKGEQEAKETIDEIKENRLEIIPVSNSLVFKAASIKINHLMAYADAFAIATAMTQEGSLLTGDPELKDVRDIPIIWIGE